MAALAWIGLDWNGLNWDWAGIGVDENRIRSALDGNTLVWTKLALTGLILECV